MYKYVQTLDLQVCGADAKDLACLLYYKYSYNDVQIEYNIFKYTTSIKNFESFLKYSNPFGMNTFSDVPWNLN